MQTNAYHYLFGQETLYRTDEPAPLVPKRDQPVDAVAVRPELISDQGVADVLSEPTEPQAPVALPEPEPVPLVTAQPKAVPQPVSISETPAPKPAAEKPKVLLLIDEELTPSELIFLENILKAIHLNLNEIDMLNLAGSGLVDFHSVLENKRLHHFISFGVPFKTIHLNIQMDRYQPVRIFGITFLLADSLAAIEADQKLKRKLWAVLKQVFLD
ncbi:hypothetical protein ACFPMF_20060 [Larkinella bovis]|uniref:Uncharacterized protein n=1 Tax=Larkinella bovis TaxID=683041 RepID=A0ABW0IHI9_9BACT